MITSENNGMYMPVAPAYGNNNGGFLGGDGWWLILLLLCGWGGMGFGGGWGGMMGMDGFGLYPWLNNSQNINGGFRDQMLNTSVASIGDKVASGFGDVQTALCGGFAGVNATVNGAQNAITQQMYSNQIADMQQSFALQSQLAQCCCDNRAATADLKYTVATENCADRTAAYQNTRDIIDSQTRGTQAILDKLCALELDGYKREADSLRQQLNMAQLAASQTEQTAQIRAAQATTANQLVSELRSCPLPAQPVYGNTPIFTCGGNACGCGVA